MNEMGKEKFSDELISAYLDNELSEIDCKRVEEVLMDSAEYRQMFNELKALHESFQSLPQYELGADFPQRVLDRAEREMAARSVADEVDPAPTVPTEATKSIPFSTARPDGAGLRTAMAWVTAVAAVLLVTWFIAPKDSENNQSG